MIEPSTFDVIVLGTGLPESILAASIASSGKTVLHLDAYENYTSPWASLTFSQFSSFASTGGTISKPEFSLEEEELLSVPNSSPNSESGVQAQEPQSSSENASVQGPQTEGLESNSCVDDCAHEREGAEQREEGSPERKYEVLEMKDRAGLYSSVKASLFNEEALGRVNRYHLDLAGPKVAFCAGPLVDALLKAQADHHVRFKAVEASYIWRENQMAVVPASRADIFRDRSLSLPDKRFLMRFFKLVTDYTDSQDGTTAELGAGDLDRPFVELIQKQHLPSSIQEIILYAIALADEDQEQGSDKARFLSVKDGFQALSLYLASASRYPDAPGAFLYPLYGQGDLPQAFCRCAAVNGAIYVTGYNSYLESVMDHEDLSSKVLRMPVTSLFVDKENGDYKGLRIASGQVLYSGKLIAGPTFCVGSLSLSSNPLSPSSEAHTEEETARCSSSEGVSTSLEATETSGESMKVARCVCIIDQSLQPGLSTILVIFPPKSLNRGKSNVVRALQLGATSDVCPDGKYVVQLSSVCSDATAGEEALQAATDALFHREGRDCEGKTESSKPKLLWSVFYVQDPPKTAQAIGGFKVCSMPDGTLGYSSMMTSTESIFHELFPEQEFLPRRVVSETEDGDADEVEPTDG